MAIETRRDSRRVRAAVAFARDRDQRDNARCWICSQPIDYTRPYRDPHTGTVNPDAYEADHVLPWDDYPEHRADPANLRASHVSCNRSRGTDATLQLGPQSRTW